MDIITINKKLPGNYERSLPIQIPSAKSNIQDEYSLKQNFFDPNKSSPPNHWNQRLLQRIGNSYECRQLLKNE